MAAPVFIDACVLFPPLVRRITLGVATRGLIRPLWSSRVLDEWRIASLAKRAEAEDTVLAAQAEMASAFPEANVSPPDPEPFLPLPDPGDTHVLAAAIAGEAEMLLTFNLRDFPRRVLAGHGIAPRHPDDLLWEIFSHHPVAMATVIQTALATTAIPPDRARAALKRARLPRLGKAFTTGENAQPPIPGNRP